MPDRMIEHLADRLSEYMLVSMSENMPGRIAMYIYIDIYGK